MKWKTMQAIVWIYVAAFVPVFLLTVTLTENSAESGVVYGINIAYVLGGFPVLYMKNNLREKQSTQQY